MRPDWTSEDEGERGKPHAHRDPRSDLPIIDPDDDDDDFDDTTRTRRTTRSSIWTWTASRGSC